MKKMLKVILLALLFTLSNIAVSGYESNCRFKEQRDVSSYGNLVFNEDNICNYDYEFKPGEMLMTEDCYVYSYDRIIRHDFKLGPNDTVVPANSSVFDPFTRLNSR